MVSRACVNKHTVNTQDLGEAISRKCTVTPADVHAVIRSLPEVMSFFMENGNSVHLDGLGSFYYKLSCAGNGVDTPEEVSTEQVKAVRVQFIPERRKENGQILPCLGRKGRAGEIRRLILFVRKCVKVKTFVPFVALNGG